MKKIFILIFLLLLLFYGSFICFKINNKKQLQDKKKLSFWTIQLKPIYEKQINSIINDFERMHPEYKVVWVDIPIQEAQKRILASILSSTPPDIVNLNPDFSSILAQKNALYIFNESEYRQFHPNLVDKLKYENEVYALPFYATSPLTVYNKEIYSKCANTNIITSYDELFKIADIIKKCSNTPVYSSSINENDVFAKILNKYNITSFKENKELQDTKFIYSNFNKMYKNNALFKDILSLNHREAVERYMSGNAVIIVTGSNFLKMIKDNAPDIYKKTAISKQLTGSNKAYDIALMNLVIPKKSKNIKMALDFINLLTNEENQMELARLTNVIPANKYTLQNNYFRNCSEDIIDGSRCLSVMQLENINKTTFGEKNKNVINEYINKTLEEILLDTKSNEASISAKVEILKNNIRTLQQPN